MMPRRPTLATLLASLTFLCACAAAPRNPEFSSWGELRRVLKLGETGGRVDLSVAAKEKCFGIGALAGLAGEVIVIDGRVWVSEADGSSRVTPARLARSGEQATLLALAEVDAWDPIEPGEGAALHGNFEEFGELFRRACMDRGLDLERPIPFLIEGEVASLDLHVLGGACPYANPDLPPETAPFRATITNMPVRLVGFYAEGMQGRLTHHGSNTHVHVLTQDGDPIVAHVESFVLASGRLFIPSGKARDR